MDGPLTSQVGKKVTTARNGSRSKSSRSRSSKQQTGPNNNSKGSKNCTKKEDVKKNSRRQNQQPTNLQGVTVRRYTAAQLLSIRCNAVDVPSGVAAGWPSMEIVSSSELQQQQKTGKNESKSNKLGSNMTKIKDSQQTGSKKGGKKSRKQQDLWDMPTDEDGPGLSLADQRKAFEDERRQFRQAFEDERALHAESSQQNSRINSGPNPIPTEQNAGNTKAQNAGRHDDATLESFVNNLFSPPQSDRPGASAPSQDLFGNGIGAKPGEASAFGTGLFSFASGSTSTIDRFGGSFGSPNIAGFGALPPQKVVLSPKSQESSAETTLGMMFAAAAASSPNGVLGQVIQEPACAESNPDRLRASDNNKQHSSNSNNKIETASPLNRTEKEDLSTTEVVPRFESQPALLTPAALSQLSTSAQKGPQIQKDSDSPGAPHRSSVSSELLSPAHVLSPPAPPPPPPTPLTQLNKVPPTSRANPALSQQASISGFFNQPGGPNLHTLATPPPLPPPPPPANYPPHTHHLTPPYPMAFHRPMDGIGGGIPDVPQMTPNGFGWPQHHSHPASPYPNVRHMPVHSHSQPCVSTRDRQRAVSSQGKGSPLIPVKAMLGRSTKKSSTTSKK